MATLHRELPYLDMVTDETLRLYPPAWIGPRRAVRSLRVRRPRGPGRCLRQLLLVGQPSPPPCVRGARTRSVPERFERERKTALPRGAYVPFGAGSRICIGKRFGQTEVKLVTAMVLQRFLPELLPGHEMTVREMPTLGPKGGLPMRLRARA